MNKLLLILGLLSFLIGSGYARKVDLVSYPGGKCMLFRVQLKDKGNSNYSFARPHEFLSERALKRRARQNIAIDSTDIPVCSDYIKKVSHAGVEVISKSKWNNTLLVKCRKASQMDVVKKLPFVSLCRKVFTAPDSIKTTVRSNFKKEVRQWQEESHNPYGATADQIENLNGTSLHQHGFKGRGMLIAVLDAGFMNVDRIPCLHDLKLSGIRDFVFPRAKSVFDETDHGTMVLSAMAVEVPGYYIGTAPEASYLLLRCEDQHTESLAEEDYWAAAVEYADSVGVDVINSSLGYHEFDDASNSHKYNELDGKTALISRTASMLASKGIVLVNSVGNEGMGCWKKMNFPSDAKDILTVGSITPNGTNAAFSSIGPTADGRIKPDVMAFGSPAAVVSGRGTVINDMGTSFSAPLITGLVACLWQACPEKTAYEIIDLVRKSGNNYSSPNNIFGYGVPDFWKAYQEGRTTK
jgi:subtilisin family serine protease